MVYPSKLEQVILPNTENLSRSSRYLAQKAAIWLAYQVVMTLRGAKTIFLDTWLRNNRKDVTLTMVRVLLREMACLLIFIMNVISVNFIACFWIICWFLQTFNYRGNEKHVLVLVQCHDGMITNSINLFLRLTLVFDSCKTKQIYLGRDHRIMTLDSNQNQIILPNTGSLLQPFSLTPFGVGSIRKWRTSSVAGSPYKQSKSSN